MNWAKTVYNDSVEVVQYWEVIRNFVITNLKMRYKRSVLGFVWTLLNPLLTMAVTAVVFSMLLRFNLKNFALYIFCGLVPWNFINASAINGSLAIIGSEGYIKKIYIPKLVFPINAVSTELINSLLSLCSLFLLGFFLGMQVTASFIVIPYAFFMLYVFCLGMAMILSVVTVYFRDLTHIVQISFNAFFYLCPIIYPMERIPLKYHYIFDFNPFNYFVTLFREVIYHNRFPTAEQMWMPAAIAGGALLIGYILFKKEEHNLIFRL